MSLPIAIRENRAKRGSAGDFLKDAIQDGSALSFVSAYFTVHAYHALKDKLDAAKSLCFLFGEPSLDLNTTHGFQALFDQPKPSSPSGNPPTSSSSSAMRGGSATPVSSRTEKLEAN